MIITLVALAIVFVLIAAAIGIAVVLADPYEPDADINPQWVWDKQREQIEQVDRLP